jgi:hypothetical protein
MLENVFAVLLIIAAAYARCGLLVAVLFLVRWHQSFDPSAREGTWGFRALVAPGVIALWPVILARVLAVRCGGSAEGKAESPVSSEALRRNHGYAVIALAIVGPLLFAVALIWRAPQLDDAPIVEAAANLGSR